MKSLLIAISLMMAATAAANAAWFTLKDGTITTTIDPPARFLKEPLPGHLFMQPEAKLIETCSNMVKKFEDWGCSRIIGKGYCQVFINSDLPENIRQSVFRHELAHCNGWPADHPTD